MIRRPITQAKLRAELARRLPFETKTMIRQARDRRSDVARSICALPRATRYRPLRQRAEGAPTLGSADPSRPSAEGPVAAAHSRERGTYSSSASTRRQMKAVGYLGSIDRLFGVPATTRNWNTITAIANVLGNGRSRE